MVGKYLNHAAHGRLYTTVQNQRRVLQAGYDRALAQVDVLIMPTTPMKAHKCGARIDVRGLMSHGWNILGNTAPFDITGHPSLSVPCGKSNDLPHGLMLTGRHFDEATLLRVGHAFEQQAAWETRWVRLSYYSTNWHLLTEHQTDPIGCLASQSLCVLRTRRACSQSLTREPGPRG